MEHKSLVANHPQFLHYDFGPEHPLRPERITLGLDLLESSGKWSPPNETLEAPQATAEELQLVHDPAYIEVVEQASVGHLPGGLLRDYGLSVGDNPAFPGMHEAAAYVAGGSIAATRSILNGSIAHAFNPAGGLHHALRTRASGFCVYNDPALAAAVALEEFEARVLYVDLDCHHGDGVQWIFYDEPQVMTVSFHEDGRYLFPGTGQVTERGEREGEGFSINVPMAPLTRDNSWLDAVKRLVPRIASGFRPDIIISSHGADTHVWDPLTDLALSTNAFLEQAAIVHELAHEHCEGRWLAVGSGGYDWRRVVPRSWAMLWTQMTDRELPEKLPELWMSRWGGEAHPLPDEYRDPESVNPPAAGADRIQHTNEQTVALVEQLLESTDRRS